MSSRIVTDMFVMLLLFHYTFFPFHIFHVIMNRYRHVCYVISFSFHFLHFISFMSATDMFVILLLFHCKFTYHILHVIMNRFWLVCYVTFFSITRLHFISYMSSPIDIDLCCYVYFFFISLFFHFITYVSS